MERRTSLQSSISEDYDSFDADAIRLGKVSLTDVQLTTSTVVPGKQRRVTSRRLLDNAGPIGLKPPRKQGMLQKRSPALLMGWQTREVDIHEGILKYFKQEKGQKVQCGTLNFDLYHVELSKHGS